MTKAIHEKNPSCPDDSEVEKTTGFFKDAYKDQGFAPWDIGRPQKAIVELESAGEIKGSVLDVGCGTGENSLFLASKGHKVLGIDIVDRAIQRANEKAKERGVRATFRVQSAFKLDLLGKKFDTVIDCGMFHTLGDDERNCFLDNLRAVLVDGGTYQMLCFSEKAPRYGPRHLSQAEIRSVFHNGLSVKRIKAAFFETTYGSDVVPAWMATIERT